MLKGGGKSVHDSAPPDPSAKNVGGMGQRGHTMAESRHAVTVIPSMQTTAKPADTSSLAGKRRGPKPRVLAADDQQHILEAIELLLRPQGYEVETAQSPAIVRELLSSGPYDTVLID